MKRLGPFAAVLGVLGTLALAACENEVNAPELPTEGFVRVANLNVGTGTAIDVYADGNKILSGVPAGQVSDFVSLPARTYAFRVTPAGGSTAIRTDTITLFGGPNGGPLQVTFTAWNYTSGSATRDTVFSFVETFRAPPANVALLRLGNCSTATSFATIRVDVGDNDLQPGTTPGTFVAKNPNLQPELSLNRFQTSEDVCPAGCTGGITIPAGTSTPIGIYSRTGTTTANFVYTRLARFVVNLPAGAEVNGQIVGNTGATPGAVGPIRLILYDINGVESVIPNTP